MIGNDNSIICDKCQNPIEGAVATGWDRAGVRHICAKCDEKGYFVTPLPKKEPEQEGFTKEMKDAAQAAYQKALAVSDNRLWERVYVAIEEARKK